MKLLMRLIARGRLKRTLCEGAVNESKHAAENETLLNGVGAEGNDLCLSTFMVNARTRGLLTDPRPRKKTLQPDSVEIWLK